MTLDVEASVLFANTPFTTSSASFAALTLGQFEQGDRAMVQQIIQEVSPNYLTIVDEPDTEAALTHLTQLDDPTSLTGFINYVLNGLDRGTTLVGAGEGTWETPEIAHALARGTNLDYIGIHVYPLTASAVSNALAIAGYAQASGMRVAIEESWLYKVTGVSSPAGAGSSATVTDFRRDYYGFFAPLDAEFASEMADLARAVDADYLSLFRSDLFFAYLDYDPSLDTIPFAQLMALANRQVYAAMQTGAATPTGQAYQQIIAGTEGG